MFDEILEIRESWSGAELIRLKEMPYGDPLPRATAVGSKEWFRLLHVPDLERFKFFPFMDDQLDFLVRRETREAGDIYFVAYKRIRGSLRKAYIGKPSAVTIEKLHEVGRKFKRFQDAGGPAPVVPGWENPNPNPVADPEVLKLQKEVDRLKNELSLAKQDIKTRKKIHEMYRLVNIDKLVVVEKIVTQWNERATGKNSHRDRTWQHALHLLRELNEALKIDSPGSAEEQPAEGGN